MSPEDIIPNSQIRQVHGSFDFGTMDERHVINQGLLKIACGYHPGSTVKEILIKHDLIQYNYNTLTTKGCNYLWAVYGGDFVS